VRGWGPGQRHDHRASELTTESVTVQGRELRFPIEVRTARSWAAQFLVDRAAAQRIVEPTGLHVVHLGHRALFTIAVADYEDSDLDAYQEVGLIFLVTGPRGNGIYIHHLPVNQEFTLAAGREIWGYPKFLTEISVEKHGGEMRCTLGDVLELEVKRGLVPTPLPAPPTYTALDGVLRLTRFKNRGLATARPGGAAVTLGSGPIADELRSLGLPKRALATTSMAHFRASFGPAEVVTRPD
jgi:acetoacetate decarboxylase